VEVSAACVSVGCWQPLASLSSIEYFWGISQYQRISCVYTFWGTRTRWTSSGWRCSGCRGALLSPGGALRVDGYPQGKPWGASHMKSVPCGSRFMQGTLFICRYRPAGESGQAVCYPVLSASLAYKVSSSWESEQPAPACLHATRSPLPIGDPPERGVGRPLYSAHFIVARRPPRASGIHPQNPG
jgi:hypothetical protein